MTSGVHTKYPFIRNLACWKLYDGNSNFKFGLSTLKWPWGQKFRANRDNSCHLAVCLMTCACDLYPMLDIELDLNNGVNQFRPIRGQDSKIGGYHLAFCPTTFVLGRGLNSESSWKCDHFCIQPLPETASHNLDGSTHRYSSIQSSSM